MQWSQTSEKSLLSSVVSIAWASKTFRCGYLKFYYHLLRDVNSFLNIWKLHIVLKTFMQNMSKGVSTAKYVR